MLRFQCGNLQRSDMYVNQHSTWSNESSKNVARVLHAWKYFSKSFFIAFIRKCLLELAINCPEVNDDVK